MKIIEVRNKEGGYPSHWTLLCISDGQYYLGGSAKVCVVKNSQVNKVVYEAKKQMKRFNLQYMTRNVEFLEGKK